jgi:hypothetical protein
MVMILFVLEAEMAIGFFGGGKLSVPSSCALPIIENSKLPTIANHNFMTSF